MIPEDKDIDNFFASIKNMDSNTLVIKEFELEIKKRQGSFSETE